MKKKKRKLSKIKYLKIYLKNFLSIFILKYIRIIQYWFILSIDKIKTLLYSNVEIFLTE